MTVNTQKKRPALTLKLRQQALKLGMTPGTPRWRAYVLGTSSLARLRKQAKMKGGVVTPPK